MRSANGVTHSLECSLDALKTIHCIVKRPTGDMCFTARSFWSLPLSPTFGCSTVRICDSDSQSDLGSHALDKAALSCKHQ